MAASSGEDTKRLPASPEDGKATGRAWVVWALGLAAYAVAVFQRSSLAVSGIQAQHRLHVGAAELSLLLFLQLGVYAFLQIPVGMLVDRWGSRRTIAAGAAVMAAGQGVLALAGSLPAALVARALVGSGDAMTFVSVIRVIPAWFPARQVPLLTQLTALAGQVGQVAAAYPLVGLLRSAGWTASFAGAAAASSLVSVAVVTGMGDRPAGPRPTPEAAATSARRDLQAAWREPGTRLGFWTHFSCQFSANVFVLLWGYPFLVSAEGVSPTTAGALLSLMVLLGMGIGPAIGELTGRWPLRRSLLVLVVVGSTATIWTLLLAWPGRAPFALVVALVVVLSSNGPGSLIGFDYVRTFNPPYRVGAASGIVNVGGFVASLLSVLAIGVILDRLGVSRPGQYSLGAFRVAFVVQYPLWALGIRQVLRVRMVLRARRAADAKAAAVMGRG